MREVRLIAGIVCLAAVATTQPTDAQVQMPNLSEMSGVPLPASDVPDGSVSVRLVRGALSNNLTDHDVELTAGGRRLVARTDENGRARFTGLTAGTRARARAMVDGRSLESQEFEVPARGGIRLMLVAPEPGSAPSGERPGLSPPPQAPAEPQPGIVVLGPQSRFVIEQAEEALQLYALLDVRNTARVPVTTPPLVFELPVGAQGAAMLEGSSAQARAEGRRITVNGPFAPGVTLVQFAYVLPYSGGSVTIEQKLPAALEQLSVVAQRIGDMHLGSPQLTNHRDEVAAGKPYIVADGPGVAKGGTLRLELTGLPHRPTWPRNLAIALAAGVLLAGAWAATRRGEHDPSPGRQLLEARRETLLNELARLEERRQIQGDDPRTEGRIGELRAQLERVYGGLDGDGIVIADRAPAPRVKRSA